MAGPPRIGWTAGGFSKEVRAPFLREIVSGRLREGSNAMRKVVVVEPNRLEIVETPIPKPSPTQVLIETRAVGLCTTDLYVIAGKDPDATYPSELIGHEPNGVVVEVGSEVTRFRPGDRVATLWALGGFMAYADYYLQEESHVFKLPENVPFAFGLAEPLAAISRAVFGADIQPGDTVCVVGAGYFGQLIAQGTRYRGAYRVGIVDLVPERLAIARRRGADGAYNLAEDGVSQAVGELTGGAGFDLVFEVAGVQGGLDTATELVRHAGTIYVYGLHVRQETLNIKAWHYKCPRIQNNLWMYPFEFGAERWRRLGEIGLAMLSRGMYCCEEIITGITALDDLPAAFDAMMHRPHEIVKAVIGPQTAGIE
jgi:L-iditol 2-dehydrogenase